MSEEELEKEIIEKFGWLEEYLEVNEITMTEEEILEQLEKRLLALYNWALANDMAVFGGHLVYYKSDRIMVSVKVEYSNVKDRQVVTIDYNDLEIGVGL